MSAPATRPAESPAQTNSPVDDGVKLATIARAPNRELRMRWREFKGHQFLDIREWTRSEASGEWWPMKGKGITIKARELTDVIGACEAARRLT